MHLALCNLTLGIQTLCSLKNDFYNLGTYHISLLHNAKLQFPINNGLVLCLNIFAHFDGFFLTCPNPRVALMHLYVKNLSKS